MPFRAIAVLILSVAAAQVTAQDLDLVNATLVDGTGAEPRPGVTLSVRSGRIAAIHDGAPAAAPGVRSIEHGTWVDDETLATMSPLADPIGNSPDDVTLRLRTQAMMGPLREAVRKAHAHDMALLREFGGLTPLVSITAATLNGARVIGIDSRTGTIRVGLEADLVAYDGDPLADGRAFFEPRLVVSDGRVLFEGFGL